MLHPKMCIAAIAFTALALAQSQNQAPPSVSQVVIWSTVTQQSIQQVRTPDAATFTPTVRGAINGVLTIYTENQVAPLGGQINDPTTYTVANPSALSSALGTNIAVALSLIPITSPTSGVITKLDPVTGAELPSSSTLGPIFTQRAETIGRHNFYIGVTHQDYHFTSLNGQSLNGIPLLYPGGNTSGIVIDPATNTRAVTAPATFNMALDVRLSQDLAFLTYGLTKHMDVSVGLPMVHAAVAATAYNGLIYSGTGTNFNPGNKCWCVNTFAPGSLSLTAPEIGQASRASTGFGDLLLRVKGAVLERPHAVLALGTDIRFPTGDEKNYLGTGTASVKPFVALSLYSNPMFGNVVFAPHVEAGWQYSGKSILAGSLVPTVNAVNIEGSSVNVAGAPFVFTKGNIPDIFNWGVGTEVALGRRNTLVFDIIGNQIGWLHGVPTLRKQAVASTPGCTNGQCDTYGGATPLTYGLLDAGRTSYGEYGGAFGYKAKLIGKLVFTFQALVRFNDAGLTARFVPLYGLGYSF